MLLPAAVLVVLLLGAVAVDAAITYLAQREAYNVAFDAANDAAGAGIDADLARTTGEYVYDGERVATIAGETVSVSGRRHIRLVDVSIDGDIVAVTVEVTVEHLFVQAFGRSSDETLRITARARGETGGP